MRWTGRACGRSPNNRIVTDYRIQGLNSRSVFCPACSRRNSVKRWRARQLSRFAALLNWRCLPDSMGGRYRVTELIIGLYGTTVCEIGCTVSWKSRGRHQFKRVIIGRCNRGEFGLSRVGSSIDERPRLLKPHEWAGTNRHNHWQPSIRVHRLEPTCR